MLEGASIGNSKIAEAGKKRRRIQYHVCCAVSWRAWCVAGDLASVLSYEEQSKSGRAQLEDAQRCAQRPVSDTPTWHSSRRVLCKHYAGSLRGHAPAPGLKPRGLEKFAHIYL